MLAGLGGWARGPFGTANGIRALVGPTWVAFWPGLAAKKEKRRPLGTALLLPV